MEQQGEVEREEAFRKMAAHLDLMVTLKVPRTIFPLMWVYESGTHSHRTFQSSTAKEFNRSMIGLRSTQLEKF